MRSLSRGAPNRRFSVQRAAGDNRGRGDKKAQDKAEGPRHSRGNVRTQKHGTLAVRSRQPVLSGSTRSSLEIKANVTSLFPLPRHFNLLRFGDLISVFGFMILAHLASLISSYYSYETNGTTCANVFFRAIILFFLSRRVRVSEISSGQAGIM